MVTEKRGVALTENQVALHMFLDVDAAFDKMLHPIILYLMHKDGIDDNAWTYFQMMHGRS